MGQQMRQGGQQQGGGMQNGGYTDFKGYGQQPQFQQNPWASAGQGGMPGSTNSMYPNQQQFAPKPMMDPAQSFAGSPDVAPQGFGISNQPGPQFPGSNQMSPPPQPKQYKPTE
jgi:hypothetical protein